MSLSMRSVLLALNNETPRRRDGLMRTLLAAAFIMGGLSVDRLALRVARRLGVLVVLAALGTYRRGVAAPRRAGACRGHGHPAQADGGVLRGRGH